MKLIDDWSLRMLLDASGTDVVATVTGTHDTGSALAGITAGVPSNGTTPVNIVAAPATGEEKILDTVTIRNTHGSTSWTVTVQLYDGSTAYQVASVLLGAGESYCYARLDGRWRIIDAYGRERLRTEQGASPTSSALSVVVLGSDVTNNNASANTIADVTGLSFSAIAGTLYRFRAVIRYTAAATTTGSRWAINGPGSPTVLSYMSTYSLTTTTQTTNHGVTAYDTPAASNATSAATAGNTAIVEGFIQTSSDGTVIVRFASEVSSSAIVAKAGSFLEYQAVI